MKNDKKLNTMTAIYCGCEFSHYTKNGGGVWRAFFVDEDFTHYEFFTLGGAQLGYVLRNYKRGVKYCVKWKHYGQSWKKIIYNLETLKP